MIGALNGGANSQIANRQNIGTPQSEHQKHMSRPHSDSPHLRKPLNHFVVGERLKRRKPDPPGKRLFCQVPNVGAFLHGKPDSAELFIAQTDNRRRFQTGRDGFQPADDGRRCLAADLLIDDGPDQSGKLRRAILDTVWSDFLDQLAQHRIGRFEMKNCLSHTATRYFTRRTALGLLGAAPLALAQEQETTIKVDVDRVNILFSVRDKQNSFVNTLTKEDFEIREDAKVQEIKTFSRESDLPLTLGLLVDVSVSQGRLIDIERSAAAQFFRQVLRQKDVAFLISFGSDADLLQDITGSASTLERALRELHVSGAVGGGINPGPIPTTARGTILFDAVYLAATEKLQSEVGRKAVILITDGVDQGSRVKQSEAINSALKSDALIYSIYYVDPMFYGGFGGGGEGTLKKMSDETGGRLFHVDRKNSLESIFQQIQEEMRSQYAVSYSSTNPARDGGYRKLEIKTKSKDLKVQARKGYFAPSS